MPDERVYGTWPADLESLRGHKAAAAAPEALHPKVGWLFGVRWLVLGFWICLTLLSLLFAPSVFDRLNVEASPLRGSELARAEQLIDADFLGLVNAMPLVVMISCRVPCETVVDDATVGVLQEMSDLFEQLNSTRSGGVIITWTPPGPGGAAGLQRRLATGAGAAAGGAVGQPFQVSADRQNLIWLSTWILPRVGQEKTMSAVRRVRHLAERLDRQAGAAGHKLSLQGLPILREGYNAVTIHEVFVKDVLTVPFALAVFLYQVQSWRLALLVGACVMMSLAIGLASLALFVGKGIHLNTMVPALMMVTCISMSVDYALFIMARFAEELRSGGRSVEAALSVALAQGGGAVALSGGILVFCFASCLLFPGDMIYTLALGAMLSLVLCLLTSLSFAPCAIAAFPGFFAHGLVGNGGAATGVAITRASRGWFKLGTWLTRWPFLAVVPLAVYAAMLPVVFQLAHWRTSEDVRSIIPAGELRDSFSRLNAAFPNADTSPILLYFSADEAEAGAGVASDRFFDETCARIQNLVEATAGTDYRLGLEEFRSVVLTPTEQLAAAAGLPPGATASCPSVVCLRWSHSPPDCPFLPSAQDLLHPGAASAGFAPAAGALYRQLWATLVSASGGSSLAVLAATGLPPRGTEGGDAAQRALWEALEAKAGCPVYWGTAIDFDLSREDYRRFPWVVALSVAAMCLLISVAFKAALVPFKLLLTVLLPLACVFGLLLSAYGLGTLDALGIPHVNSDFGLHWMIPVVSAPVLMGLAVDYDVFLFARAYELRLLGFGNREAVVGALATTGPIISGAGLVMALTFGGMLLSSVPLNCQLGFALSMGVLLDTFVTRPFLAPSVLVLGGSLNFWPQALPEVSRSLEELEEWLCGSTADCGCAPPAAALGAAPAESQPLRMVGNASK